MKFALMPIVLTALLLAASSVAADSQDKEAKEAFDNAVKLYRKSLYEDASKEFRRANAIKPAFLILYNIGQSEAAAKRYGLAFEAFEEYISKGGDEIAEDRREEVVKELERLSKVIGSLEVSAPAGSLVVVDDMVRGTVPLPGKIRLAIGVVHHVEIKFDEETIHSDDIKVSFGEIRRLEVQEEPESEVAAAPPLPSGETEKEEVSVSEQQEASIEDDHNYKTIEAAAWATLASGGAMLLGAIVTGTLALQKNSALNSACQNSICPQEDQDKAFTRDNLALSTDILIGAGATAAVVGAVLLIWSKKKDKGGEHADISPMPILGNGTAGVGFSGAF